jgi:hypothetical protein
MTDEMPARTTVKKAAVFSDWAAPQRYYALAPRSLSVSRALLGLLERVRYHRASTTVVLEH